MGSSKPGEASLVRVVASQLVLFQPLTSISPNLHPVFHPSSLSNSAHPFPVVSNFDGAHGNCLGPCYGFTCITSYEFSPQSCKVCRVLTLTLLYLHGHCKSQRPNSHSGRRQDQDLKVGFGIPVASFHLGQHLSLLWVRLSPPNC